MKKAFRDYFMKVLMLNPEINVARGEKSLWSVEKSIFYAANRSNVFKWSVPDPYI